MPYTRGSNRPSRHSLKKPFGQDLDNTNALARHILTDFSPRSPEDQLGLLTRMFIPAVIAATIAAGADATAQLLEAMSEAVRSGRLEGVVIADEARSRILAEKAAEL
jgi:hypothetical protein